MNSFHLEVITPERRAFTDEVQAVYVPTRNGTIGVLPHHLALFTELTEGEIKIVSGQKEFFLAIGGGFMEVAKNAVSILVSRAVHADELNEAEIRHAESAAKEALARKVKGDERANAQALLRRSFVELKVLRRRRPPRVIPS